GAAVTEASGTLDGVADATTGVVGTVDKVLLEASSPVLVLGGKVVGTRGSVVTSTTDTLGQVSGGFTNLGGAVTTTGTAVGGGSLSGSLSGGSLSGGSLNGSSLTGGSLAGSSPTGGK